MAEQTHTPPWHWTVVLPAVAFVALLATWGRHLSSPVVVVVAVLLAGAVLAAVHHAEVVALRVGEPYFLPVTRAGELITDEEHADPPTNRAALVSLGLLLLALVAVVGDAKAVSPSIESAVEKAGFPPSFVGVVIALLVLLPETLAAVRAARRDRVQTSLNLSLGSAMASIGLTIPAIAGAMVWLDGPLVLGLGTSQIVLLGLTVVVGVLTVVPGRATLLQGGLHLVVFAAFIALAINP